jgi:hypothetical protein
VLESTPDLESPDWRAVSDVSNPYLVSPQAGARRFFRLRQ